MAKTQRAEEIFTDRERATVRKLYDAFYSVGVIAERLGVPETTIKNEIKEMRRAERLKTKASTDWSQAYADWLMDGQTIG